MTKIAFLGFGEVNTPVDVIIRKCRQAECNLKQQGLEITAIYPIADDEKEEQIQRAVGMLQNERFDALVLCVAGWIPAHAVIKITEPYRHVPMVLWGLCGWYENGRLISTADQAGTSGLRAAFEGLGYRFAYFYDIAGKQSRYLDVARYCHAASAASRLRSVKIGMAGYRDMNLYGTLYDGLSLKKTTGLEIETFELLEAEQRYRKIPENTKLSVVNERIREWNFLKPAKTETMMMAAGYYLAFRQIAEERHYSAISIKDVDGMKKLCGFPPAPIFMLLSEDGYLTIPENDALGASTQALLHELTGQLAGYVEFYEFFEHSVLAGVPDFVAHDMLEDKRYTVLPAVFGQLNEGILNVSKLKTGPITLCRLGYLQGKYTMQMVYANAKTPMLWEECGWAQPAPQLSALEIEMDNVEAFAEHVLCQHYLVAYGDHRQSVRYLCALMQIDVQEL